MENNVGKLQDVVLGNTIDAPLAELTYLAFSTVKVEGAIAGQLPGVKSASFTSPRLFRRTLAGLMSR